MGGTVNWEHGKAQEPGFSREEAGWAVARVLRVL
jgi:hypothetical protein